MAKYSSRLTGLYINTLRAEMGSKTRKAELTIIAGCLDGLNSSLVNFTESAEEGSKFAYDIFKAARMAIDPKVDLTRYDVPRAGLKLLAKHASQFSQFLIDDYDGIYEKLSQWSHHTNPDMLHLGMMALDSFLTQISDMLVTRAKEGKKEVAVFKYFISKFRDIMQKTDVGDKELNLAIRGYGLLAAPCRTFLSGKDVQFMFTEMMTKTEQQFLGTVEDLENRLHNLSSYLESLANIVRQVDDISESYAMSLEYLLVLLLENLPQIHTTKHFLCQKAILSVLLAVMPKGVTFSQILSGFVFQGLIRTCSHQPVVETENEDAGLLESVIKVKKITYKDFVYLWIGLLDSASIKDFAAADISIDVRHRLTDAVYDELLTAIIRIIQRLDLTSISTLIDQKQEISEVDDEMESTSMSADPLQGVQAKKPKDFQVFINLVDFCRVILPVKHCEKFERWMFPFTQKLILMSTENPLASGFYKLLAMTMQIANKQNFFQFVVPRSPSQQTTEELMETDDTTKGITQRDTCFQLVKKFSKEVLVRMKQYRDDLLASCLTFILALPKEVILEQMAEVVPVIQVTLRLGLSYLPLALVALDAMEYWSNSLSAEVIQPYYVDILPCLDSYLKASDMGSEDINVENTLNMTKSKTGKGRKKLSVRLIKGSKKDTGKMTYQSQLADVKQRIVRYLGGLGGSVNVALLAKSEEEISERAITWDTQQHLRFDIPFVDMKPTIYFDPFLPHVVELASKSSDRQTKVAACELLHSLILYCLGRGAQQPDDMRNQERYSMAPLYKKLFPAMLQLACDVEQVSHQLFEPLSMQMIHWLTNNKRAESEETMVLLNAIYDGLVQGTNTALRDFCAKCLNEFLTWSVKQTSQKSMEKSPFNAKSVLKRLFSYSLHPGAFQRLGAALAWNNIYGVFRQEDALVDMFTFELLVHFVESLAIAHTDEKSLGTQDQCCKALDHLERIIKVKVKLLQKPSKNRTEPKQWSQPSIDIAVRWLLRQCGRPQTECRHACMKLVYQLSSLIPGISSTRNYFQTFLKSKGAEYFITRFEGGGNTAIAKSSLQTCPTMVDVSDCFTLHSALSWFDMVLAALDCYTWVLGEGLLTPTDLFIGKSKDKPAIRIFETVIYFLGNVALKDLDSVTKLFPVGTMAGTFTPKEIEDFNRTKCTVIVRLLNFLTVLIGKYQKDAVKVIPAEVWCSELWESICYCVVQPTHLGFNIGEIEILTNLPKEMEQTLTVLSTGLPINFLTEMKKGISQVIGGERNIFSSLPLTLDDPALDPMNLQQVISGYKQLHKVELLLPCFPNQKKEKLTKELFDNIFQGIVTKSSGELTAVTLSPSSSLVAKEMLELAFLLELPAKSLVDAVLNMTVVSSWNKNSVQHHGELFFTYFKTSIVGHIVKYATDMVSLMTERAVVEPRQVSMVLTATVDHLSRDRELRKKHGPTVLSAILSQWKHLSSWWDKSASQDQHSTSILLLTKLLLIDSKFASTPSHTAFDEVFQMYLSSLTDTKLTLSFKCRVLDLLPFFAVVPESHEAKLKSSLDRLVADNFPLHSSEFPKGSPKFQDYIGALNSILNGLELSGSLVLLEVLISIFCREQRHVHEDAIQASIAKFTKRLPLEKQRAAAEVPFKIFMKAGSYPAEIRRATLERVCVPILRLIKKSSFIEFCTDHIKELKDIIDVKMSKTESVLEGQLTSRLCCFQLLEVLYTRLSKEELTGNDSAVNKAFCDGTVQTGKELTQYISKAAHEAKGEDIRGENILLNLRRQYHCAAYNLLIAVISCTQTDSKFYTGLLFKDDEPKGQFLLQNIIYPDKVYEFPIQLQSPLERQKKFVSIHKEVKQERGEEDEEGTWVAPSFHLASQYLADSSLSEDISQYNYTISTSASPGASEWKRGMGLQSSKYQLDDENVSVNVEEDYVELELDELNQHECMPSLIALLQHMQRTGVTPEVKPGTAVAQMPPWMMYLNSKMSSSSSHFNVKLFIAKLIVNTSEIFKPYAKFWLRPLCQLIFSSSLSGAGMNYFIVDLVVTMLSWHKTAIPQDNAEEKAMASRLVQFLIANVYHEYRPVFRNNLEMLKTTLECWKDRVDIPYQEIYKHLKPHGNDSSLATSITGVQTLGVVISCQFGPYGPSAPVDREKFFSSIANFMGHKNKAVYAASAEVVGMIFQYLAEKDKETDGSFHSHVNTMMTTLHLSKPDSFIVCVHRMMRHYPAIADRFLNKLLFMLPNLYGEFKTLCLEVIHARVNYIENVFLELKSKGFVNCLSHRNEGAQLVSLKIVKDIAAKLKPSELNQWFPLVTAFTTNPSTACRNEMYQILMWVYDNYRDDTSEESNQLMVMTKEGLLRGLGEEDLSLRLQVQNFWSSETRLPVNTLDRLVAMLEAMYSPVTEQQYLSYATNLILEMTSKSPDYQREIFEHPLSECRFQDYAVKSSWRQRHAAMTPLFATQSTQSQMETEDVLDGQVRATQTAQFSATMEPGSARGPFNWLTQRSLDTYSDQSITGLDTQSTQSSLLFAIGSFDMAARVAIHHPFGKPGPRFGKRRNVSSKPASGEKKGESEQDSEIFRLKRRFIKDQENTGIYFAKQQIRLKQMREEIQRVQKLQREHQVTMYRKYRTGDLPDIQIKYSYIIAPLQALAHRDNTVAKLLFGSIFKSIFQKMDEVKTDREIQDTVNQINTSIDTILSGSNQYFPPFIGCVLDILYSLRTQLKVDVASVGACALFSKLQPLGIAVLEEQLIQQEPDDTRPVKRIKMDTTVSKDVAHWIELARLHKSVNEFDVLLGIFGGKIGTQSITQEAVEAEARGDFNLAFKKYEEALQCDNWPKGKPLEAEIDLWDDCRMECLCNLMQWEDLQVVAVGGVDDGNPPDLTKVWEDTFYQEHYLPFILRSKLKLMLQGDENQQDLLTFIDNSMKVPDQKILLENRYSQDLALMYVWQEDYDRARHYANMALASFQQEWSSTDSLMVSSRVASLQSLQPLIELHEFLKFIANESNFTSQHPAKALANLWQKRSAHHLLDPVGIWDDIITNRNVYLEHIGGRLKKQELQSQDSMEIEEEANDTFQEVTLQLKLNMADSCKLQNNFKLTLRILQDTYKSCKNARDGTLLCTWTHLYASTHHKKVHMAGDPWSEENLNSILTTLDQLDKLKINEFLYANPSIARRHHMLSGAAYELLALGLHKSPNDLSLLEDTKAGKKLLDYGKLHSMQKDKLVQNLIKEGYERIKTSITSDVQSHSHDKSLQCGLEDAYLAVAKYCDVFLRMKEDDELGVENGILKSFPDTVIVCLLKAMKLNSMEARQRFPRLLQLVETYPDTMGTFISNSGEIPCWMYILWTSQMMALLDKPEAPAVQQILLNIASTYPQAVIYPFKLSREGYCFKNTPQDKKNKAVVEQLSTLLGDEKVPLVAKFVRALEQFGQPDMIFRDWCEKVMQMLKKPKRDKAKISEDYKKMYDALFVFDPRASQDVSSTQRTQGTQSLNLEMGPYTRKFAMRFRKDVDKVFGTDGSKLTGMSLKDFQSSRKKLMEEIDNETKSVKGSLKPPSSLADYCPWMSEFNPNNEGRDLEIPGQYTGLSKPLPEYHVKVAGFDQRVMVMSSLRKPKRITILGNDEKEYRYLVKGGEDLRLDQRVEQLFFIMNQVFNNDPACRNRKLKLRTYQVIPMTSRVGLIEWMNNTIPLKEFLLDSLTPQETDFFKSDNGPTKQHLKWTEKVGGSNWAQIYENVYKKYTKADTIREMQQVECKVPWGLSRRAFHQMSTSPEAFHVLRCHCAVSHAVICISQYILGIGDRHLSNFMINLTNGQMVGIDFGHAFGSATQFLPVPELMPFRLTRQITNLMLPLGVKGLFENTMIHSLQALRADFDLLLNTMDIFVKEPSLDWLQNAEKQLQQMLDSELSEEEPQDITWYPKEKVNYVKRKLRGDNPSHITRDELKLGHRHKSVFTDFEKVVLGDQDDIRRKLPATCLTVEQQVAALINQATDQNILGRTYVGWEAWM
ncbi:hypothetical protein CHS0354_005741 [Potamilus streckersoni]|uniref:DNA-dependent protein kinase catalytic subunit n=1 Tax=Potamilus streckersoni TaxID=2493646 RepID=A0AAE0RW34_9BIVA|nr:hypothetical protein CHS0354_005741 [Potamilus streckersoni]